MAQEFDVILNRLGRFRKDIEISKTCIIILNYNNVEDTIQCIDSIERVNTATIKYIVVENNTPRRQKIEILSKTWNKSLMSIIDLCMKEKNTVQFYHI